MVNIMKRPVYCTIFVAFRVPNKAMTVKDKKLELKIMEDLKFFVLIQTSQKRTLVLNQPPVKLY